jgi:hypothetical protein
MSAEVTNAIKFKINERFAFGQVYSSQEVKVNLQEIYNAMKLKLTAKANDVKNYCSIEKKSRRINGKVVDSIVFLKK